MSGLHDIVNRANEARNRIREISPCSVEALLAVGAVLLDVRDQREYRSGHLAAAVHLDWNALQKKRVGRIIPDRSIPIVCYCTLGHRSAIAADILQQFGYTEVWSIAGGLKAYLSGSFGPSDDRLTNTGTTECVSGRHLDAVRPAARS